MTSNVISFLETLGANAALRHAAPAEIEGALAAARIEPGLWQAILSKDSRQLETLLEARANVCCIVHVPDDDEPDEDDDDEPANEEDSISSRHVLRLQAGAL